MSPTKSVILAITIYIVLAAAFYAWQVLGFAGAGNIFLFYAWVAAITKVIGGFALDKDEFAKSPRPPWFVPYHYASEVAIVIALVWIGYIWLPAIYLLGMMMVEAARKREPKAAKSGGAS